MRNYGSFQESFLKVLKSKQSKAVVLLVFVLGLFIYFGSFVVRIAESPMLKTAPVLVDVIQGSTTSEFSPDSLAQSLIAHESDELPNEFISEVLDIGERQAWVSEDKKLVGVFYEEESVAVKSSISSELKHKGWLEVESNSNNLSTFVKEDGIYQWCYVVCQGFDEGTCVSLMLR